MISRNTIRRWRPLTNLFVVSVLVIVCYGVASAEDDTGIKFTKGLWSVQFGVEDDFRVEVIDGIMVSFKKHFSRNSAYRLEFMVDANSQSDGPLPDKRYPRDQRQSRNTYSDYDGNWADMEIRLLYFRYFSTDKRVRPYWGFGPAVGYYRYDFERVRSDVNSFDVNLDWDYTYSLNAGMSGAFGVEWFAWDRVSIYVENRINLIYSYWVLEWSENKGHDKKDNYHSISRQLSLNAQSIDFGLVVYF